jgi:hypothetical protein
MVKSTTQEAHSQSRVHGLFFLGSHWRHSAGRAYPIALQQTWLVHAWGEIFAPMMNRFYNDVTFGRPTFEPVPVLPTLDGACK